MIENIDIGGPTLIRAAAKNHALRGGGRRARRATTPCSRSCAVVGRLLSSAHARGAGARGVLLHRALRRRDLALVRRARGGLPRPDHRARSPRCSTSPTARTRTSAPPTTRRRRRAHPPAVDGLEAPRQGAVVQQPARPRLGRAGCWTSSSCRRRRSSSTTTRAAAAVGVDGRGGVREGARHRSAERVRRRVLLQPAGRPRARGEAERDVRRARLRARLSTSDALEVLQQKPNVRLLEDAERRRTEVDRAGHQARARRPARPGPRPRLRGRARRCRWSPSASRPRREWGELLFAWSVVQARALERDRARADLATAGIGAGQMSRVDSVRIAIEKARGGRDRPLDGAAHGLRRLLPLRRRPPARRSTPASARHPARRLPARPRGRRGLRRRRRRDGLHLAAALPALTAGECPRSGSNRDLAVKSRCSDQLSYGGTGNDAGPRSACRSAK